MFSESLKDKSLDNIVKRVDLEEFGDSDLLWTDFEEGSCVCFDDIDVIQNTKENGYLKKKLYALMNSLIENARKQNITVVQTAHIATDGQTTKHILSGCTSFIYFPFCISKQQKNAIKDYIGIEGNNFKELKKFKDEDWVCIFNIHPLICMTPKRVYIIDTNKD